MLYTVCIPNLPGFLLLLTYGLKRIGLNPTKKIVKKLSEIRLNSKISETTQIFIVYFSNILTKFLKNMFSLWAPQLVAPKLRNIFGWVRPRFNLICNRFSKMTSLRNSSLHWVFSVFLYAIFVQWGVYYQYKLKSIISVCNFFYPNMGEGGGAGTLGEYAQLDKRHERNTEKVQRKPLHFLGLILFCPDGIKSGFSDCLHQ